MIALLVLLSAAAQPTGADLIQECRIERTKALAATNDSEFADRRYIACLDRVQEK